MELIPNIFHHTLDIPLIARKLRENSDTRTHRQKEFSYGFNGKKPNIRIVNSQFKPPPPPPHFINFISKINECLFSVELLGNNSMFSVRKIKS